jgi:hypothetical protein
VLVPAPTGEAATASGEVEGLADRDDTAHDLFVEPTTTVGDEEPSAITTEGGAVTITGETDEGGRRRRRRRRRRRGGQAEGSSTEPLASASEVPVGQADDDDDDDDDTSEASPRTDATADTDEGRSRRRRRRRGRRRGTGGQEAPVPIAPQVVVAPEQPIPQDEILIDIDESELEIVRDAFGEIDELDDFTLKGRRRGVLDTLAEEVELEDLTAKDQVPAAPAAEDSATDGEIEGDEDDDGTSEAGESLTEGVLETDAEGDSATDDPNKRKRKRRRRRKKKSEEPPPPALMAPPHKDFWEVWATHFSYTDFEEANPEPEPEPEPEPARARPPRERERERGGRSDRSGRSDRADRGGDSSREPVREHRPFAEHAFEDSRDDSDSDDLVTVRLNLGRSHDKKAANIRDLLAQKAGVAGRKVKNLTVGDRDTEFQIGRSLYEKLASTLGGVTCDGIVLAIDLVDGGVDDGEETSADGDGPESEAPPSDAVALAEEPSDTASVT